VNSLHSLIKPTTTAVIKVPFNKHHPSKSDHLCIPFNRGDSLPNQATVAAISAAAPFNHTIFVFFFVHRKKMAVQDALSGAGVELDVNH